MVNHWMLRVGNGKHFINSSTYNIWGINSSHSHCKYFLRTVKKGDKLWFVKNCSDGQLIAVSTYKSYNTRIVGPLIKLNLTNTELGWEKDGNWDIEVHYENLYNITKCSLLSKIKGPCTIRLYNEKCVIDLPNEYDNIEKYSKVTNTMN